ncbi:cyclic peptide export ABC transporter [Thalassospira mesophila]|uniref:cyclic peptide export ABC transporter n=1 Tax=Thalassospira mesophila TaxID=1293891 RepID=UPI0011803721|nr:cyclic peptide export ABC transporter [Thalassospira mesophila]
MILLNLIRERTRVSLRGVSMLTALSGIATTMILMVVNMAAEQAAEGRVSLRLLALMGVSLLAFGWSQRQSDVVVAREAEHILHNLRLRLFDNVRKAGPDVLADIGQGPLQNALTQEMQTVSASLPVILTGIQQMVLLVFVCFYMAWLSIPAFLMVMAFTVIAAAVHLHRVRKVSSATRDAQAEENQLFGGLTDLLHGFKEVRMNRRRRNGLMAQLHGLSDRTRIAKTAIKRQWGREFALIQLAFYVMMGLMVFVIPLFTTDYHDVATQTTTAALFMIGPIGTLLFAIPSFGNAEAALTEISRLDDALTTANDGQVAPNSNVTDADTAALPAKDAISQIALRDLCFAYTGGVEGRGFALGPLNATFNRGEVTFITGGNGAGKSTMISLLTGLRVANSGGITLDDVHITDARLQAYRDNFATVFTDYHLFGELYGVNAVDPARAEALLEKMEIANKVKLVNHAFSTTDLSQGQRKRLMLITAMLEDKPILVLDEWAADQDPHFRKIFYETLLPELRDQGKIVICVTHDDRWFHIADRLYHLRDGMFEG